MRSLTLLAGLLVLAPAFAQDGLTMRMDARPVSAVVAELAAKTGKSLKVSPALASHIVIVNVKDVTPESVMEKLAQVMAAKWKVEGQSTFLSPDEVIRRKAGDAALAERVTDVQKILQKLNPNSFMGGMTTGAQTAVSIGISSEASTDETKGPKARTTQTVLGDIAKSLAARPIAALETQQRVVFSTSPNQVQLALSQQQLQLLQEYMMLRNLDAKKPARPMPEFGGEEGEDAGFMKMMREQMEAARPKVVERVGKILIAVSYGGFFGMGDQLTVTVKIFDMDGKMVGTDQMQDFGGMMFDVAGIPGAEPDSKEPPKPQETPIDLSKLAREFDSAGEFNMASMGSMMADVSPELAERLRRPDLYDPLSFRHVEALAQISKTQKVNIIAVIPDPKGGRFSFNRGADSELTEQGFLKDLEDEKNLVSKDGTWLLIQPKNPNKAEFLNRVSLRNMIEVCNAKWTPSLDDLADFAMGGGELNSSWVGGKYSKVAPFLGAMQMPGMSDWEAIRFYGHLAAGQRLQVKQSGFALHTVGTEARSVADLLLMGTDARYLSADEWKKEQAMGLMERSMKMFMPNATALNEPTEVNPTGVPGLTMITMRSETKDVVLPAGTKTPDIRYGALDSEMVGLTMGMAEQMKDQPEVNSMMPDMNAFYVGKQIVYRLTFEVRPGVYAQYSLQDNLFDRSSKPVPYQSLSTQFRKEANAAQESAKNMFPAGMFGGMPGARP